MLLRLPLLFLAAFVIGLSLSPMFEPLLVPEVSTLNVRRVQVVDVNNLLVNPGFEEGYTQWQNASEVNVANGWVPWWHQGTPQETAEGYFRRPEYTAELAEDIRNGRVYRFGTWFFHGEKAQRYFTSYGTHDAGIYQQVTVNPGDWLEFSAWVRVHSSDCDDPCVSPLQACNAKGNSHGTYRVAVGIDPLGRAPAELGLDPPETGDQPIAWSPLEMPPRYDTWVKLRAFAQAKSNHVTVYLRGSPIARVKDNTVYWDEAILRVLPGTPEPTETPSPTLTRTTTPTSTSTPVLDRLLYLPLLARNWVAPTPGPTHTPSPTATSSTTATPTSTGTPVPATDTPTPSPTASAIFTLTPVASETVTATPAVTGTPVSSPTPSTTLTLPPVATDTLTATPTPGGIPGCTDLVVNGDFEVDGGWTFATTERPAAFSTTRASRGIRSLRLGTEGPGDGAEGWSIASQSLLLPTDAVSVTVHFAYYSITQDDTGDWQEVLLRTGAGVPVKLLLWLAGSTGGTDGWRAQTVVLSPDLVARLAGNAVELYLEVYNDGDGHPTALYVDEIALIACRSQGTLSAQVVAPPGTDIRIRYPIRYDPGQVNFNLPGTCNEMEFESLQLENVGIAAVDLSNWTLTEVRDGNVFTFPDGFTLPSQGRVRIWTQAGPHGPTDLYWNRSDPAWDNNSDEAILRDTAGNEIARRGYP